MSVVTMRPGTLDGHIIWETLVNRSYEKAGVTFRPDDVWLDGGGHIGCFVLEASPSVRQVVSYEPLVENARLWQQNITQNAIANATLVPAVLVTSVWSRVAFYVHHDAAKGGLSRRAQGQEVRYVLAALFSDALVTCGATALKLDVEGAEVPLLKSLDSASWARLRCVVCEFHADVHPEGPAEVLNLLRTYYPTVRWYGAAEGISDGLIYAGRS